MDLYQENDKALRKGRLLQAAATILSTMTSPELRPTKLIAVDRAFNLEEIIEETLSTGGGCKKK